MVCQGPEWGQTLYLFPSVPSLSQPSLKTPGDRKLKNNISISLWLQRYKTYKSPPFSSSPRTPVTRMLTRSQTSIEPQHCSNRQSQGLPRDQPLTPGVSSICPNPPSPSAVPQLVRLPLRNDPHFWELLSLATAPRCCGTWRSVAWRARAQRLWQKAWQWCEGPRACWRTARRRRELRS